MSTQQPPEAPPPPPPAHEPPTPEDGNSGAEPERRTRRRMYIAATALGGAFVLILLAFALGAASQNDSSSSSSSSSTSSAQTAYGCASTVSTSVDRILDSYYGANSSYSSISGGSYYPGYYPYAYDNSYQERGSLASTYGADSAEVQAFDAALVEVRRWHNSGGAYTYNTMIDNGSAQVNAICDANY